MQEKREVPSGMRPLPWVVRMLAQRLVLPDLQSLHLVHSGLLVSLVLVFLEIGRCFDIEVDILKGNDIVARLDVGHSRSDALDDTGTFMS